MLRAGGMEEFVTEEEEPWYDQRDLEQGESPIHGPDTPPGDGGRPLQKRMTRSGFTHNENGKSACLCVRVFLRQLLRQLL